MRFPKAFLWLLLMLPLVFIGSGPTEPGFAQTKVSEASLHSAPWRSSAILEVVPEGTYIRLTKKISFWYYAELSSRQTGWLHGKDIALLPEIGTLSVTSKEEGTVVYSLPRADSEPLGILPPSALAQRVQALGGWCRIALGNDTGYVDSSALITPDSTFTPSGTRSLLPYSPPRVIDPSKPMLALTFDDGPSSATLKVLQILEQHGARGTFFMLGNRVAKHANMVSQVAAQGSEIGMHTWNHLEMHRLSRESIVSSLEKSSAAIYEASGVIPTLLRPPYGTTTATVRSVCAQMDLKIVNWSVDTEDWRSRNTRMIADQILKNVSDGSIVLSHDLYDQTVEAMEIVVPKLLERGYQLVTVSEMLSLRSTECAEGVIYRQLPPA